MFGSYNVLSTTAYIDYDPAADDVLPVFVAPKACRVVGAKVVSTNGLAADGTNYFDVALLNIGTAGSGTTLVGGTIGGTVGWTALVPTAFTVDNDNDALATGEVLAIKYNENGTGTFTAMQVQIDYVLGV